MHDATWPDWSEAGLDATLDSWLGPRLAGLRRRADVERIDLGQILLDSLNWEQRRDLDRMAPTHVTVPTGSRVRIEYAVPESPRIAVRLQELFGLEESPRIADGRVTLTIELLSPAHRPVQVTSDLAGFWRTSYFDVRKEMRGRYPRHEWPEDPLGATPTRRAKRRS
jgi:ATP-dependent helicase HrpB